MTEIALITGGKEGLGRELALYAFTRNINPIITSRKLGGIEEVFKPELTAQYPHAKYGLIRADFSLSHHNHDFGNDVEKVIAHCELGEINDVGYFFWNAGLHLKGRVIDQTPHGMEHVFDINVMGQLYALRSFHMKRRLDREKRPYHIIVISSTTAYKIRRGEAIYALTKAAQVQFALDFQLEVEEELPGSKVLIVYSGGMKTNFLRGVDTSNFLDPAEVAAVIWNRVKAQTEPRDAISILRNTGGSPMVVPGFQAPQM